VLPPPPNPIGPNSINSRSRPCSASFTGAVRACLAARALRLRRASLAPGGEGRIDGPGGADGGAGDGHAHNARRRPLRARTRHRLRQLRRRAPHAQPRRRAARRRQVHRPRRQGELIIPFPSLPRLISFGLHAADRRERAARDHQPPLVAPPQHHPLQGGHPHAHAPRHRHGVRLRRGAIRANLQRRQIQRGRGQYFPFLFSHQLCLDLLTKRLIMWFTKTNLPVKPPTFQARYFFQQLISGVSYCHSMVLVFLFSL
jgi:hypothetical protein